MGMSRLDLFYGYNSKRKMWYLSRPHVISKAKIKMKISQSFLSEGGADSIPEIIINITLQSWIELEIDYFGNMCWHNANNKQWDKCKLYNTKVTNIS